MPDAEINSLFQDVTKLYVETASVISQIYAEQDSMNKVPDQFPPKMAHEIVVLDHSNLCEIIRRHRERFLVRWFNAEIDIIEQEYPKLVASYTQEHQLQSAINVCDDKTTFD